MFTVEWEEIAGSGIEVILVCSVYLDLLQTGEVEEVSRTVGLVVELQRISQLQLIVHCG